VRLARVRLPFHWIWLFGFLLLVGCDTGDLSVDCTWTAWDHPQLTYQNGWIKAESGAEAAWSGASVNFLAPPGPVEVDLSDNSGRTEGEANFVAIFYDDVLMERIPLRPGRHRYRLPSVNQPTQIVVGKATEPMVGTIGFHGVCLAAEPLPVQERMSLVLIGDSITAGYGALATSGRETFHPSTEAGMQAYGARAARILDLVFLGRAWSGRGVFRNSDGSRDITMRELWSQANPLDRDVTTDGLEETVPALIGINLGTNDFAQGQPPPESFVEAYLELIAQIRARWEKEIPIIVMLGTMLQDRERPGFDRSDLVVARELLQTVVQRRRADGDERIFFFEMRPQDADDGFGANYHPSLATQKRMADELVRFIRDQGLMQSSEAGNAPDQDRAREPALLPASNEVSDRAAAESTGLDSAPHEDNP